MANSELDGNQGEVEKVDTKQEEAQKIQEENNEIEMIDNIEVLKEEISRVKKSISDYKTLSYIVGVPIGFLLQKFFEHSTKFEIEKYISLSFVGIIAFVWYLINTIDPDSEIDVHAPIEYYNNQLAEYKYRLEQKKLLFDMIAFPSGLLYLFFLVRFYFINDKLNLIIIKTGAIFIVIIFIMLLYVYLYDYFMVKRNMSRNQVLQKKLTNKMKTFVVLNIGYLFEFIFLHLLFKNITSSFRFEHLFFSGDWSIVFIVFYIFTLCENIKSAIHIFDKQKVLNEKCKKQIEKYKKEIAKFSTKVYTTIFISLISEVILLFGSEKYIHCLLNIVYVIRLYVLIILLRASLKNKELVIDVFESNKPTKNDSQK